MKTKGDYLDDRLMAFSESDRKAIQYVIDVTQEMRDNNEKIFRNQEKGYSS